MDYCIQPATISGRIKIPSSKSHTLRAIIFASLAQGESVISDYLPSPDTVAMINACRELGAVITESPTQLHIRGVGGTLKTPSQVIDAGNSGQVLRFIAALATLCNGYTVLTGDASVRGIRPMQPLLDGLTQFGAFAVSTRENGHAPIVVRGPLLGGKASIQGQDSQPVSALLIACSFAPQASTLQVHDPGEIPWVRLTLSWLARLGIAVQSQSDHEFVIKGGAKINGFDYIVPGDFSSALFPLVASVITCGQITLDNLDMDDAQGDKAALEFLHARGVALDFLSQEKSITYVSPHEFLGGEVAVNDFIDALPVLAVLGCFGKTPLRISGAAIARHKESDRITCISDELRKMGAKVFPHADGLVVEPSVLHGATLYSHHDHRIAMALSVAALGASGASVIQDCACVAKSYPEFAQSMQQLGAKAFGARMKIMLIGLPNVGKTTIGTALANSLAIPFMDCDRLIEQAYSERTSCNYSISKIHRTEGEVNFRQLETAVMRALLPEENGVIATGGGCALSVDNDALFAQLGTVIYLACSFEKFAERVQRLAKPLPLVGLSTLALQAQYAQRTAVYAQWAHHTITVDDCSVGEICDEVMRLYRGTHGE